jgi:post-segregation antitoxin (ccd killing protein)
MPFVLIDAANNMKVLVHGPRERVLEGRIQPKRATLHDVARDAVMVTSSKATTDEETSDKITAFKPSPLGSIVPNKADILSGRGAGINVHEGNILFRRLVYANRFKYRDANAPTKKLIVNQIRRASVQDGGRFLEMKNNPDQPSTPWIETCNKEANRKIGQALRDACTMKMKQQRKKLRKQQERSHPVNVNIPSSSSNYTSSTSIDCSPTAVISIPEEIRIPSPTPWNAEAIAEKKTPMPNTDRPVEQMAPNNDRVTKLLAQIQIFREQRIELEMKERRLIAEFMASQR